MQHPSIRFIGGICARAVVPQLLPKRSICFNPASYSLRMRRVERRTGSSTRTNASSSSSSSSGKTNIATKPPGSDPSPTKAKTVAPKASSYNLAGRFGGRVDISAMRNMMREDNMWSDGKKVDTKWLRPRDPNCYKPDFGQTEPHTLRERFMRSPDERTREAMGRDWKTTQRFFAYQRQQPTGVQGQKQGQTETATKTNRMQRKD